MSPELEFIAKVIPQLFAVFALIILFTREYGKIRGEHDKQLERLAGLVEKCTNKSETDLARMQALHSELQVTIAKVTQTWADMHHTEMESQRAASQAYLDKVTTSFQAEIRRLVDWRIGEGKK